jgi:hypothetical protein
VRDTHHPGPWVGEQHRDAVRRQHCQPDARQRGHRGVGTGTVGITGPRNRVHHGHLRPVHLVEEHDPPQAQFRRQPPPVGRDRHGIVPDAGREVEPGERAGRAAARTGGDHPADAHRGGQVSAS